MSANPFSRKSRHASGCLSASQVVDVAEHGEEQAFETAVAPLMADIDGLFLK